MLTTLTDLELTLLLKEGDHDAYAEIFRRYYALLFSYAYKKLQDQETAKDVVQEVFFQLWNKRRAYTVHSQLVGYLYRAVRNKALDIFAHQQVARQYVDSLQSFMASDQATADVLLQAKEVEALIDREIALMPKGMREVFELSRKQYLSHKEIAAQLGMSEAAVNKQIKRALKTLRLKLGLPLYLLVCSHYQLQQKNSLPPNVPLTAASPSWR